MTNRNVIFLVVAFGLLIGLLVGMKWLFRPGPQVRQEMASFPGAVAYSEVTSSVPALFLEAQALLAKQDVAQAASVYQKIVTLEPNNASGYVGLASCSLLQDDLAAAEKRYGQALSLDARSSMALLGLGSVAHRRGEYQDAVTFYQRAKAIAPSLPDAHWGLAISLDAMGNAEQAASSYARFLQLAPESSLADRARSRMEDLRALHDVER